MIQSKETLKLLKGGNKKMKKILILAIVGILVFSGIGTAGITSEPLTSHKQMQCQRLENKEKLQFAYINVHVKEIYGTFDNPQYRPLANVEVTIEQSTWIFFWELEWKGTTNENGTTGDILLNNGEANTFKTTITKEGYHAYGCLPFHIDYFEPGVFFIDVYFTMADDNGPFIKSVSQQSSNKQNLLCNLLLQQMVRTNK
jgi:hypothetical protein